MNDMNYSYIDPRIDKNLCSYAVLWIVFDAPPQDLIRTLHPVVARTTQRAGIKVINVLWANELDDGRRLPSAVHPTRSNAEGAFAWKRIATTEDALSDATCEELRPCMLSWDARRRGSKRPIDDYLCFAEYCDASYRHEHLMQFNPSCSKTRATMQLSLRCALFREREALLHDVLRVFVDGLSAVASIHSGVLSIEDGNRNNSGRTYIAGIDANCDYDHAWRGAKIAYATHAQTDRVPSVGSWTIIGERMMKRWQDSRSVLDQYNAHRNNHAYPYCQHKAWVNDHGVAVFQAAGDPFELVRESPAYHGHLQQWMEQSVWLYWKMREADIIM